MRRGGEDNMAYCRSCGIEVNENAVACTGRGVRPNDGEKFCQDCGKKTEPKAIMCVACGVNLKKVNHVAGSVSIGNSGGVPNSNPVGFGNAILWFLCCIPIGFSQWGQTAKGWTWVLISFLTGGVGGFVAWIDYWMSYNAQKTRKLDDWEFFPSA